jgi:signal transduction histidine kinase
MRVGRSAAISSSLDEVVEEAVETALAVEPDRPIELERSSARVIGDRERLRQIVDNILATSEPTRRPARRCGCA